MINTSKYLKIDTLVNTFKHITLCIVAAVTIINFTSCCKACVDSDAISISYNKFRKHEIDTIIKLRYQRNSNFSILIDSSFVENISFAHDTTYPESAFAFLYLDADCIIKLPSVGKTFAFSNYQIIEQKCACENKNVTVLKSFTFNENLINGAYYVELPR